MASRARKPCAAPGCPVLVPAGVARCPPHTRAKPRPPPSVAELARPNAYRRGYGRAWRRARAAFLAVHPLCRACSTDPSPALAQVVDHIVPHKGDKGLFWDQRNWQPLCKRCHDSKTWRETRGLGPAGQGG